MAALCALAVVATGVTFAAPPAERAKSAPLDVPFTALRALPIQANGRVKPFDTFCREHVYEVTGERAPRDASGEDPVFTVLQMALEPGRFAQRRVIAVRNLALTKAFTGTEAGQTCISLADFDEHAGWRAFQQTDAFRAAFRKEKGFDATETAIHELYERAHLARETAALLRLLPVSDLPGKAWLPIALAHTAFPDGRHAPLQETERALREAFERRDPAGFEQAEQRLVSTLRGHAFPVYPPDDVLALELTYNRVRPFRAAYALCFLAAALLIAHRTISSKHAGPRRALWAAGLAVLGVGLALHVGGIAARTYITQFAPVGSLYETAVWIGGVAVLMTFALEAWTRAGTVGVAGALFGGVVLGLADRLPLMSEAAARHVDPAMNPLAAVLRSYWLHIHVTCMLTSYGALGLACALGLDHGVVWARTGGARQAVSAARDLLAHALGSRTVLDPLPATRLGVLRGLWAKHEPERAVETAARLEGLELFNHRVIQVGFTLLTAGVLLGAVWANQSWGRYWGWDPKETWAFITWLIYAAYIHFRFLGWIKGPGSTLWNLVGFACVIFTYLGVSFLLPGKHSYLEPS